MSTLPEMKMVCDCKRESFIKEGHIYHLVGGFMDRATGKFTYEYRRGTVYLRKPTPSGFWYCPHPVIMAVD